jgi:uracil-DNA glycosylase family 4
MVKMTRRTAIVGGSTTANSFVPPPTDCRRCKRLYKYLQGFRKTNPDWHNAPVDAVGSLSSRLLIVGLAPGMRGANATGRPFTGDSAGGYLYHMLARFGFAHGTYGGHAEDGVTLGDVRITNAVRCVPPQNKPTAEEATNCRPFLQQEIAAMDRLHTILALGKLAHDAVLRCFGCRLADYPFAHGSHHLIDGKYHLISSYHCSRYNTQTGRLTDKMFTDIFQKIQVNLE